MPKTSRPVTEPSQCRDCNADVLWVKWPKSGKKMPVDAVADNRGVQRGGGKIVLTLTGGEYGELIAEKYYRPKHGDKRNRYTSHFDTCPNRARQ